VSISRRTKFLIGILSCLTILNLGLYLSDRQPDVSDNKSENVLIGIHDQGYENSSIQSIENGLVTVWTVDTKSIIVFRLRQINLKRFRVGSISPITFDCGQKSDHKCDLSKPYKLYASSVLVELIKIK